MVAVSSLLHPQGQPCKNYVFCTTEDFFFLTRGLQFQTPANTGLGSPQRPLGPEGGPIVRGVVGWEGRGEVRRTTLKREHGIMQDSSETSHLPAGLPKPFNWLKFIKIIIHVVAPVFCLEEVKDSHSSHAPSSHESIKDLGILHGV